MGIPVTLKRTSGIPSHMNLAQEEEDAVVCEACGRTFEDEQELARHVRAVGLVD